MPALYSVYRGQGYTLHQELKPHPLLVRLVRESCPQHLRLDTALVPALCPPQPWTKHTLGGYLLTKTPLMRQVVFIISFWDRLNESEEIKKKMLSKSKMPSKFFALNKLRNFWLKSVGYVLMHPVLSACF